MLKNHEQHRVHDMLDAGLSVAEIAERTGRSLGTIYKYKNLGRKVQSADEEQPSIAAYPELVPYEDVIDPLVKKQKVKARDVYFELQRAGYTGSRLVFDDYFEKRHQELHPKQSIKHLEPGPGQEAQVDWGHFGEATIHGRKERIYLFSYVLSWSRALYMEFVVHQNQKTLQACHMHAFEKLGVPKTILYDNMKTVVNRREKLEDKSYKVHYNQAFLQFTRYYKFKPIACSPYYPQSKGKVESSIKYARNYFSRYTPKRDTTLEELNAQLSRWVDEVAQQRNHRSINEKPYTRWLEEKAHLASVDSLPPYNLSPFQPRYATQYGVVHYKSNYYCLGTTYARKKMEVREVLDHGKSFLEFYYKDILVETTPLSLKRHMWIVVNEAEVDSPSIVDETKVSSVGRNPKKHRLLDITVEERDLSYYDILPNKKLEVSHG